MNGRSVDSLPCNLRKVRRLALLLRRGDGVPLTYIGHAYAILLHRAVPLIAPLHAEQRRLEQMLVDTVQLWPTGRAT